MRMMHHVFRPFRRFLRDDSASVTVEAVMVLPLLIWGYFGMFILFEGYRALSTNIRVSYTISDLLSREVNAVNADYIDGLNAIQEVMTQSAQRTVLRVSVVSYDEDADDHALEWSYSTPGQEPIEAADIDTAIIPYLPPMPHGGQLVVVETWMAFEPFMNISLDSFYFESLVTTRPRFAGQLIWES